MISSKPIQKYLVLQTSHVAHQAALKYGIAFMKVTGIWYGARSG